MRETQDEDNDPQHGDGVDVIVPLYNNFGDAQRLFASLQSAKNTTVANLIVVDDASTDISALQLPTAEGSLRTVLLLKNSENLGYASSINRALVGSHRDVVLLNSDTIVFDGWLDRLRMAARMDPVIGTVTPISNAATIYSYPIFPHGYREDLETSWEKIAQFCADFGGGPVTTPTAVGFCMFIKRECLDQVGMFDAVTFRQGYGEENDFCRRAISAGWRHVAAPDVFVWHRDQGSFLSRAEELRNRAEAILRSRYPAYRLDVGDFIRRDPLSAIREHLDYCRIKADRRSFCLRLESSFERGDDAGEKIMRFSRTGAWNSKFRPVIDGFGPLPNLPSFTAKSSFASVQSFLERAGVIEVVVPKRRELPKRLVKHFERAARAIGLDVPEGGDDG